MMTCSPPTIGWVAHTSLTTAFLSRGGADRAGEPSHLLSIDLLTSLSSICPSLSIA
jgi:hypothetical protein